MKRRQKVIHSDPDDSGAEDDIHGSPNALADNFVRSGESLSHSVFWHDQFPHAIVVEGYNGIGVFPDDIESSRCLIHSALSLKSEGQGGKHNQENALFFGNTANFRSSTGTGSSTKSNTKSLPRRSP